MSAERIRNAALLRFAAQGYKATSLSEIAGDVGIKTPSIYSHFSGKEELFWQLAESASCMELEVVRESLLQKQPAALAMHEYLFGTIQRFANEPRLRFWLRTIYLPPPNFFHKLSAYDRRFAAALNGILSSALRHPEYGLQKPAFPYETLAFGFTGMLRAVHAELLYHGSENSEKTLTAMWDIFEWALKDTA